MFITMKKKCISPSFYLVVKNGKRFVIHVVFMTFTLHFIK